MDVESKSRNEGYCLRGANQGVHHLLAEALALEIISDGDSYIPLASITRLVCITPRGPAADGVLLVLRLLPVPSLHQA